MLSGMNLQLVNGMGQDRDHQRAWQPDRGRQRATCRADAAHRLALRRGGRPARLDVVRRVDRRAREHGHGTARVRDRWPGQHGLGSRGVCDRRQPQCRRRGACDHRGRGRNRAGSTSTFVGGGNANQGGSTTWSRLPSAGSPVGGATPFRGRMPPWPAVANEGVSSSSDSWVGDTGSFPDDSWARGECEAGCAWRAGPATPSVVGGQLQPTQDAVAQSGQAGV